MRGQTINQLKFDLADGDVTIRQTRPRLKAALKATAARKPGLRVTAEHVTKSRSGPVVSFDHKPAFTPYQPATGVLPKGQKIAMDSQLPAISWAGDSMANIAFSQGYAFLGYPYLSELAQVAEYRLISEVISTEATRKWIKIKSAKDEAARETGDKDMAAKQADKIKALEEEFVRLGVRKAFEDIALQDGFFGRAHLYLETGASKDPAELVTPIGDGGEFTQKKFKGQKGFLRSLKTVEPVWTYPMNYNAQDPLADDWYRPEVWYVMSKPIHVSRLLTFVSKPVPDLMKPSFSFGGLSMTQMAKPYVDNWLETRQSVNDIIQAFSVMVLSTDLQTLLQDGNGDGLYNRADLFNNLRNNRGLMMLDKNSEEFKNVAAPLSGLDHLQAQAQEHMASVSRIPLVKLTGISPSGLNATSEYELDCFYETIHAYQEKFFTPHLTTVFKLAQLNIWGEVDPDLSFEYEPLAEMDEKEKADIQKVKAETHGIYIDKAVIDPAEVRQALADDPEAPYDNIDPDEVPAPVLENENIKESETDGPDAGGKGGEGGDKD